MRYITSPQRLIALLLLMLTIFAGSISWGQTTVCLDNADVWTGTGLLNTTGQGCDGEAYVFNGNGDIATSPVVTNPNSLTFQRKRSSNTTAWSMDIQISTNAGYTTWTTVATLTSITASCASQTVSLSTYTGARKIRFVDTRSSGAHERTISDIEVTCGPTCTSQTITAISPSTISKTVGDATYSVATTATSGLTVTYSSSNTSVVSVSTTGVVTVVGAGTATITAAQAGNTTYCAATSVTQSVTVAAPPCTSPDQIAFQTQPSSVVQDAAMTTVRVRAMCSSTNTTATNYTGPITLTLNAPGCGYVSQTVNAVAGVATFSNIRITRSPQSGIRFTAAASGFTSVISNTFNVTAPATTATTSVITQNNFDALTTWTYAIGTGTHANDVTGIKAFSSNNVLSKSSSVNNSSSTGRSSNTVTFSNVTSLTSYSQVIFEFQIASLGSGSGAGNDNDEDATIEVSTNGGTSWTTILTQEGSSDRLFALATGTATNLSLTNNATYTAGSSLSAFKLTLSSISQFRFRFTAANNRSNENWVIDNVKLSGVTIPAGSAFNLPAAVASAATPYCNTSEGIQLGADATSFKAPLAYSWTPTSTLDEADIENPVAYFSTASQTYTVTLEDADKCRASSSVTVTNPGFGGVAGLWTGEESTDWFDCRNWDDFKVPTVATNVTINQTASDECIIQESDAVCNSLTISSTNGTHPDLTLETTGTLTVSNDILLNKTAGSGTSKLVLLDEAVLTCRNFTIDGYTSSNAKFEHEFNTTTVTINGNLTIETGGELDLSDGNNGNQDGIIHLRGNFINNATETDVKQGESTIIFDGSGNQSIQAVEDEVFYNIEVNKTGGDLTLNRSVRIEKELSYVSGNILSSSTNLLIFNAGSSYNAASDASHSVGYVRKTGNTPFTFPVGNGDYFRPASISAPSAATDHFTATYLHANPHPTFDEAEKDVSLNHISSCEYWMVNKTNGSSSVSVTLSWNAGTSCAITDLSTLRVARWDGTSWKDHGNGGTTGGTSAGSVVSGSVITDFSPFTLGSTIPANPLPVELVSFAVECGDNTRLKWSTASEQNSDYFSVEKTADGISWREIDKVQAAGNTSQLSEYNLEDASRESGTFYYRLVQFDLNGESKIYEAVSSDCEPGRSEVNVFPNPSNGHFSVELNGSDFKGEIGISLASADGKLIEERKIDSESGSILVEFERQELEAGIYFVAVADESGVKKTVKINIQ